MVWDLVMVAIEARSQVVGRHSDPRELPEELKAALKREVIFEGLRQTEGGDAVVADGFNVGCSLARQPKAWHRDGGPAAWPKSRPWSGGPGRNRRRARSPRAAARAAPLAARRPSGPAHRGSSWPWAGYRLRSLWSWWH